MPRFNSIFSAGVRFFSLTFLNLAFLALSLANAASANSKQLPEDAWQELLNTTQEQNLERLLDEEARLQLTQKNAQHLAAELKATQAALRQAKLEQKQIEQEQEKLEQQVQDGQERLQRRSTALGEVFAVFREEKSNLFGFLSAATYRQQFPELLKFAQPQEGRERLPQIEDFERLWHSLQQSWQASAQVVTYTAPWVNPEGEVSEGKLTRLGDMQLQLPEGVLRQDGQKLPSLWQGQPKSLIKANQKFLADSSQPAVLDPARGLTFELHSRQPTFLMRVQQGGFVGYVIIVLGVGGLLVALVQSLRLLAEQGRVNRQLADLNQLTNNNSLGRVLAGMQAALSQNSSQALEASLDEHLLKEGAALEKGLALVKLLAAMAPLLGLLGTVTGMIATFQAITLFGTGDPSLMAAGISQALVTTVQGLLAAVPLLLAHLLLQGRSRKLARILEAESSAFLAQLLGAREAK